MKLLLVSYHFNITESFKPPNPPFWSGTMMKKLFSVSRWPNSLAKINCQKIREQFFSSVLPNSRRPVPDSLYRRITPVGDPAVSIVPVLDQWIRYGNSVDEQALRGIVYVLRNYKRFKHALEVSQWMTEKRYIPLNSSDVAMRMNLILRVHGLEQVEKYFANIPRGLKSFNAHIALLNCYSWSKSVDKAESLMQKAKDMGYIRTPIWYNIMMNLHCNMGDFEKLDQLMDEMEKRGFRPDRYTLTARLKAYTAVSDSNGIDNVIKIIESDSDCSRLEFAFSCSYCIPKSRFNRQSFGNAGKNGALDEKWSS